MLSLRTLFSAEFSRHDETNGPGFRKGLLPKSKTKVYLVDFAGCGFAQRENQASDLSHQQSDTVLRLRKRPVTRNGQSTLSA